MMKIKKKILVFITAVMGMSLLVGCGSSQATSGNDTVDNNSQSQEDTAGSENKKISLRIAEQSSTPQTKIAEANGYFKEEFEAIGVDVEIEYYTFLQGSDILDAYAAGKIDIAYLGDLPAVRGISNEYDYSIIANGATTYTMYPLVTLAENTDINSVEDLAGKKIGTTVGVQTHYVLLQYLEYAGILDQVELVNASGANLLQTGDVQAMVTGRSYLTDDLKVLIDGSESNTQSLLVWIADNTYSQENPEVIEAFIKAIQRANEFIETDKEAAAKVVAENSEEIEETEYVYLTNWTFDVRISDENISGLDSLLTYAKENELLSTLQDYTIDDTYDLTYLEAAGFSD